MCSFGDLCKLYTIKTTAILKLVDVAQTLNAGDTSSVVCLNQRAIEQHSPHHLQTPGCMVLRSLHHYRQMRPYVTRVEFFHLCLLWEIATFFPVCGKPTTPSHSSSECCSKS
jgi:hypothetical protein